MHNKQRAVSCKNIKLSFCRKYNIAKQGKPDFQDTDTLEKNM